jgi:starch synthase (maltosyl-transferring)
MPVRPPLTRPLPRRSRTADKRREDRTEATAVRRPADGIPEALNRRVVVERIRPAIDGGRWPIKRTVGEAVHVSAAIFADGHDVIIAVLRDRHRAGGRHAGDRDSELGRPGSPLEYRERSGNRESPGPVSQLTDREPPTPSPSGEWRETPMTLVAPGTDEWTAGFTVGHEPGWHEYQIVAWVDRFVTWRRELEIKAGAGQDVAVELQEGVLLIRAAAGRAEQAQGAEGDSSGKSSADRDWLRVRADALGEGTPLADRVRLALDEELRARMGAYCDRSRATTSATLRVWVDRERARFGAWYEMFPRSAGRDPGRSGTFAEAAAELPRIADLGFDVVYLPPIHPIGRSFRKGRNNSLTAGADDPGSPWAIGSAEGGHTAIEPGLGTIEDFSAFRAEAERLGLEVALDIAWQCSPDHPWVHEHPEWFRHRPDGTIKYAENPPKKYQDIYPFDFESDGWRALWQALLDVVLFWIGHGVKIFRVDNPHTKTFGFWEWMIDRVHQRHPGVIFLSEAFTRPPIMRYLAKAGFTQSYTYFTWRNNKAELTEYLTELTTSESSEYLRPNLFVNTPDILHAYLQQGGRAAFEARLLLAATLGASYGMYSGFELLENRAVAAGSEEYLDSEKYQYRKRQWDRPGNINELVCRVNRIRHQSPALQVDRTLRFHATDNPEIIAYSKTSADGSSSLLMVINLDPHHTQHGHVEAPVDRDVYVVHDLLDDERYTWHRGWNYVRFDPAVRQGHILKLEI